MADAVGCVMKAIDLALKIKDAVDTVRQNRKDCADIKRRTERVRHTLSLCESNAELMESPAVHDAVQALAEVLGEALELVAGCQEQTNAVCLYCTARKLSKQLSKVDRGISDGNLEATFAILVYHISKQTGDAAPPAMPTETEPYAGLREEEDTELGWSTPPISWEACYGPDGSLSPATLEVEWTAPALPLFQLCGLCGYRRCHGGGDGGGLYVYEDNGVLLQKMARVTRAITTGMETVRRNKEECAKITKLASRASGVLLELEDKERMKDTAVLGTLKRLLITFRHAHELVVACQRRSVVVLCSSGKLSSELRGVLDEMMRGLDDLIDVLV